MINIIVAAVGKMDEMYRKAADEYLKRSSRFSKIEVAECKECGSGGSEKESLAAKDKEGQELLKRAKGFVVAMDKGGEMLSSEQLAAFISDTSLNGESRFTFVVGGSDGLSKEVLARADKIVSFGNITLPHQLARLVLLEQIYRALTINNNIAYHK